MAVAHRTAFSATGTEAGGTTFDSASIAILAGDTVYVMFASSDSTPAAPTGVKWDPTGANQSLASVADQACGPNGRATVWRGQGLTPATAVFRATWGGAGQTEQVAGGVALTGVSTTTPNGTIGTGTGTTSASATATATTVSGQFVFGMCHNVNTVPSGATTFTATSGTERFDVSTSPSGFDAITGADQTAAGASTNTTWTISQTSGSQDWRAFAIPVNAAAGGDGPPDPRRLAMGRRVGTVQGRALFEALQTLEYIFSRGVQSSISAADGSSSGSAAGTVAVGAASQTADAASSGSASATVAVGVATQKADASSAGDASSTVANSNQTVALATPLYPDPRYLTYGRLLGTPLMRAQAVLNWVIAPTAVVASQFSTADGSSTGAATAVAVGASSQTADFSSAGSAAGTIAVGASTQKADFTAAGVAVPIAVGSGVTRADALSTASATAIAISASKQVADALSQVGSTPIAVGAASQKADATSAAGSGASTIMVPTTPFSAADGSSAGSATAVGVGASSQSADGLVIAGATPVAVSQATQAAAASSAGSAAGTTADATAPSPPIVVTLPTGITLEGGGAAQKWLHAKGDKKRRMARIERQDTLDMIDMAEFAPQVQAYFAGKGGLPHAAR